MKSNHDLVVLNRDQLCEENVQRDSKIMIKRNYKDETDCSTGSSENQERHGSFLRSAILKDEERRQIQMQDASKRKDAINVHGHPTRKYGEQIIDNEKEERTLQFRRFVEQASEVEDDIKGESQNEDDERDDDDATDDDDSDDEKDEADEHGTASKKRKAYRVKPDPKYNGMKYSFCISSSININKS